MPGTAEGHDSRPWLGRPTLKVGVRPAPGEEAEAPPPVPTQAAVRPFGHSAPDLAVQAVTFPRVHGNVAREGVE